MDGLSGKVALVTGGGQGLGEAICRTLGEAGVRIVAADIRGDRAEALVQKLSNDGIDAMGLQLDVGDEEQGQRAIGRILEGYGTLDILINNAGMDRTVSIEELDIQDWDRIVRTNLRGPFILSKLILPVMKRQRNGHIVNVVSTAAKR